MSTDRDFADQQYAAAIAAGKNGDLKGAFGHLANIIYEGSGTREENLATAEEAQRRFGKRQ